MPVTTVNDTSFHCGGFPGIGVHANWTYAIASSLYGDPTDPGMAAYMAVAQKYSTPADAPDPWNIVNFGQLLTTIKIMNEVGYANLSPSATLAEAKAFTGPQALGAPSLACGKYSSAPAVCNDRIQLFEYTGGVTKGGLSGSRCPDGSSRRPEPARPRRGRGTDPRPRRPPLRTGAPAHPDIREE